MTFDPKLPCSIPKRAIPSWSLVAEKKLGLSIVLIGRVLSARQNGTFSRQIGPGPPLPQFAAKGLHATPFWALLTTADYYVT